MYYDSFHASDDDDDVHFDVDALGARSGAGWAGGESVSERQLAAAVNLLL